MFFWRPCPQTPASFRHRKEAKGNNALYSVEEKYSLYYDFIFLQNCRIEQNFLLSQL